MHLWVLDVLIKCVYAFKCVIAVSCMFMNTFLCNILQLSKLLIEINLRICLSDCSSLDNTIGELNARNRVGGGLHDEFPVRDSSDHSRDFTDYTREPLNRPPFINSNESSSELDDQASSLVSCS